jgi:uncharacterized protein YhbP (UPF0306 family)
MPESLRQAICEYLQQHTTLSLATCNANQAWSTDLFYASDDRCQLYFVSSNTTRHCQHIAVNPDVSISISAEFSDWDAIIGLQLDGTASVVSELERTAVIELYLAKFPALQNLYCTPAIVDNPLVTVLD